VDFPDQVVLEALILGCPLRIVTADYGGAIPENAGDLLDGPALP
jgi:glycosyltransferase involved in cell wall biosynthesis